MADDALALLLGLVTEDGQQWGEQAAAFQFADAAAVLADPHIHPRRHFQVRPRGASKTTDAAAVALSLMVTEAPKRSRSYCYAADQDQANELLDALAGFALRTPGLAGAMTLQSSMLTVKATGATLSIESSDAASAWSKRPWLVVVDELTSWPQTRNYTSLWSAVVSALPKRKDSRLLVLSMAGSPSHFAAKIWKLAQASPDWRASAVPGPTSWWTDADIESTRILLTASEFRRYVLAEWVDVDAALSSEDDVLACVRPDRPTLSPQRGVRYVAALDVGTRRDLSALVVAHVENRAPGRTVVVDRVVTWRPSPGAAGRVDLAEVEATVGRVCREYGAKLRFDRSQAEQLTQNLARRGVRVDEYLFSSAGANRLARAVFNSLRDRSVEIPDDPETIAELMSTRLVETQPGLVKLSNPPGAHDDVPTALGMVLVDLLDRSSGLPASWGGRVLMGRQLVSLDAGGNISALRRDHEASPWGRTEAALSRSVAAVPDAALPPAAVLSRRKGIPDSETANSAASAPGSGRDPVAEPWAAVVAMRRAGR